MSVITVAPAPGRADRLVVASPFCPQWAPRARQMAGSWDGRVWTFDARDEGIVRAALREIYGDDGSETDLVTVTLTARRDVDAKQGPVTMFGRVLASATGRDSGARVGAEVRLVSGRIKSAGSVKNWYSEVCEGAVFQMHDVPRATAEALRAAEEAEQDDAHWTVEILEPVATPASRDASSVADTSERAAPSRAALEAERAQLVARLAAIDAQLTTLTRTTTEG